MTLTTIEKLAVHAAEIRRRLEAAGLMSLVWDIQPHFHGGEMVLAIHAPTDNIMGRVVVEPVIDNAPWGVISFDEGCEEIAHLVGAIAAKRRPEGGWDYLTYD